MANKRQAKESKPDKPTQPRLAGSKDAAKPEGDWQSRPSENI